MLDIAFVTVSIAFFALCIGYINWCDRLSQPTQKAPSVD